MTAPPQRPRRRAPPRARRSGWSSSRTPQPPLEDERLPVRLVLPGVAAPRPAHRPGPRPRPDRRGRRPDDDFGPSWSTRADLPDARRRRPAAAHAHPGGARRTAARSPSCSAMTSVGVFAALPGGRRPRVVRRGDGAAARRPGARLRAGRRRRRGQRRGPPRRPRPRRRRPARGHRRPLALHRPADRLRPETTAPPPIGSAGARSCSGSAAGCSVALLVLLARAAGAGGVARRSPWCRSPSRTWPPSPCPTPPASRPASGAE